MKNNFLKTVIFLSIALQTIQVFAQEDESGILFHKSETNPQKQNSSSPYRYAIYANGTFAFRGGASIGLQYRVYDGIALSFDYGKSLNDFAGKISLTDNYESGSDLFSNRNSNGWGNIFEYALKYYFSHSMHGGYISAAYASINNKSTRFLSDYISSYYSSSNSYSGPKTFSIPYTSREFKLLFGFTGVEDSHQFIDFNFGLGYRLVDSYYLYKDDYIVPGNTNQTIINVTKKAYSQSKPWFYLGFKWGVKF